MPRARPGKPSGAWEASASGILIDASSKGTDPLVIVGKRQLLLAEHLQRVQRTEDRDEVVSGG